jgi:hypothetical protein
MSGSQTCSRSFVKLNYNKTAFTSF